jgi:serine/threonine protein kinase
MIGTEIGSYKILEKLGQGGMGVVYKAVDTGLDRMVAMKVLNPDLSKNPDLVERFRAEARAQANLNHTNLATLYAFMVHQGTAIMVMEFVEGETFAQMIRRRGPIPEPEAVPLFRQALLGIGYAHRSGIIHRDIKPSNLMLNKNGLVKVMDFGIAKVLGVRGMTRTGAQLGTLAYMSPEQIQNRNVDIRSDIYELGITLYEMLSGHLPFESDSEFQIMQDHVYSAPPPPSKYYPYIGKGIEKVILKSLEKNSDMRFQTVEQFGAALEHPDALVFTPSVSASDAVTASGTGTPMHPHLSVSAVPPPITPPGTPYTPPPTPHSPATPATPSAASMPEPFVAPTRLASQTITPVGSQTAGPTTGPATGSTTLQPPTGSESRTIVPPQTVVPVSPPVAAGGIQKKWIILGVCAVVLLIAGVGAYQVMAPVPHGGGSAAVTPLQPVSVGPSSSPSSATEAPGDTQPPMSGSELPTTPTPAPKPAHAPKQPVSHPKPPEAQPDQGQQMYQKAQDAISKGRYFEPTNDCALYWAIQARKAGNANGQALENQIAQVYKARVTQYYNGGNYAAALALVNAMLKFYPDNPSLLKEQKRFQAALAASNSTKQ